MSVFLRRALRAASTRRSFSTNQEKRKIEYVAVNVGRNVCCVLFCFSPTQNTKAFGEPRKPDSLESFADLFRVVSKEEAEQLGVKRSKGWRLYLASILMMPVLLLWYVGTTTRDFMDAEQKRLELERGIVTHKPLVTQDVFRGNPNSRRSIDALSDAEITQHIQELTRTLDDTRDELAKLRAEHDALQQKSAPPPSQPPTSK